MLSINLKQLLKILIFYLHFVYFIKANVYDLHRSHDLTRKELSNSQNFQRRNGIKMSHIAYKPTTEVPWFKKMFGSVNRENHWITKNETNNENLPKPSPNKFNQTNNNHEINLHQIEQKISSIINEHMEKLTQKLTEHINHNMSNLADTIKQVNKKNEFTSQLNHLIINTLNEEYDNVNHKYKCSNITMPRSCDDLKGCNSDIYNLMLPEISDKPFPAACDLQTLNGGWTIIQRRQDGSENFYRNWSDYAKGFGNVNGEFFLGLNKIHALTTSGETQELYIILESFDGIRKYARYGEFKIDSENNGFKLTVNDYTGTAGDSLTYHSDMKFTTKDRDNDNSKNNCATIWEAAWWYKICYQSNLNGQYYTGEKIKSPGGIVWGEFQGLNTSLKFTQMMIRTREDYEIL